MKRILVNLKKAQQAKPPMPAGFLQGLGQWWKDPDVEFQALIDVPDSRSDALRSFLDRYSIPYTIERRDG